jgi:cytochrome c oxidase subunit 2
VIHSFFVPQLRLKQDALPGKTIPVWFEVTDFNVEPVLDRDTKERRWIERGGVDEKTGRAKDKEMTWELACAEFCGARHSLMRGKLYVHKDPQDFKTWLDEKKKEQDRYGAPGQPDRVVAR